MSLNFGENVFQVGNKNAKVILLLSFNIRNISFNIRNMSFNIRNMSLNFRIWDCIFETDFKLWYKNRMVIFCFSFLSFVFHFWVSKLNSRFEFFISEFQNWSLGLNFRPISLNLQTMRLNLEPLTLILIWTLVIKRLWMFLSDSWVLK